MSAMRTPPVRGRPTWAEINLGNLRHNLRTIRTVVGPAVSVMAAVKADAYGHGAVDCARALELEGIDWFGVALPEEGSRLRAAGIGAPILCLGGFWDGQEGLLIAERLTPAVFRIDVIERLNQAAEAAGVIMNYHLKIDTGMRRLGVPIELLPDFLNVATRLKNVRLDGIMTHLASADLRERLDFTHKQIADFQTGVELIKSRGIHPTWLHQANTAGTHAYPEAHANLVRVGGALYGLSKDVTRPDLPPLDLKPVLSLHTAVELLKTVPPRSQVGYGGTYLTTRDTRIATLPVGYEDGLPRILSNRGQVLVRGGAAPIIGRVSMDLTLIDVTELPQVEVGDEVVIIGSQGDWSITAEEVASIAGSISYEVTCRISDRVPRVNVEPNQQ